MESYKVYVKTGEAGHITAINSSVFLGDVSGLVQIDEGVGDKYHHAQGNYLAGPLMTADGLCAYKLQNGAPALRGAADLAAERAAKTQAPTAEERLAALEEAMLAMMEADNNV